MYIMDENQISKIILDCAFKVHTALGPLVSKKLFILSSKSNKRIKQGIK